MRKIAKKFNEIWSEAESRNQKDGFRFYRIFEHRQKYVTMGIYDTVTKQYSLFDTINLVGNFRYSDNSLPGELRDMEKLVRQK